MGLLGILLAIGVAFALSSSRRSVRPAIILWGLGLQALLATMVLRTPFGALFEAVGRGFHKFIQFSEAGTGLVFGDLGRSANGVVFAFQILPIIILVSCISAILYHVGLMPKLVAALAVVMQRGMRASGAESLNVAANLFLGQAEAPLTIRPYLLGMTRSELMMVMTSGMATVSGAMLVAYVQLGAAKAEHLLAAVAMTAPACVMFAKIFEPETGRPATFGEIPKQSVSQDGNLMDAAARGTSEGLSVALHVGAMVLVFVALVGIINGAMAGIKGALGVEWMPASIQDILGPMLAPVAFLLGVEWADASVVGNLLGTRTVLNELISFAALSELGESLQPRSALIASYALCGFANIGSVGIMIGALGTMLPTRRTELAALGLRAMLAATLSNFVTAAIAGLIAVTPILDH